jgi:hypothetical protein
VTNLSDHDPGSLRDAIATTPPGGTVDFQPDLAGTITLTSGGLIIGKDLTIAGPSAGVITVSGNQRSGVFDIFGGFRVEIAGLTIAEGFTSGHGGGIQNFGALTVTGCTLTGNFSVRGGGIANLGTLTVIDSMLTANSADLVGGGIYNVNSTATVTGSTLTGNSAGGGGAIANEGGTLTVDNSTLSGNSADGDGGAITNGGPLIVITSSTLTGNIVTAGYGSGGAISDIGTSTQAVLRNTILAANQAASAPDVSGHVASRGYNLIGNGSGGSGFTDTDLVGTPANQIDPLLGPLQDNGGPTQTQTVLAGSPALNAGDPSELGNPDQRGVVRSGGTNIGAYQASATAFVLTAPATVQAGVPFDVTVTAVDPFNQVAVGYTGTVTFSTTDTDPGVVLPADYTFTLDDGGTHTFTDTGRGETTLITPGDQMLTVMDTADNTITGSANITVSSTPPSPGTHWPGDVVWLPPRLMHHRFGESEPLESYWLDGADFVRG